MVLKALLQQESWLLTVFCCYFVSLLLIMSRAIPNCSCVMQRPSQKLCPMPALKLLRMKNCRGLGAVLQEPQISSGWFVNRLVFQRYFRDNAML